jgi:ABC-2 type transport system ATP-binding protein
MLSYFAALKGVRDRARVMRMLEMVNLHQVAGRAVGGFSGGMKQRLGIAQALINDPDVVVVDEPTAGLDPEERVRFRNVLSEIGFGKLVILSTHIVADIESIATSIAVMRGGAVVLIGTPEELLRSAVGSVWQIVLSSEEFEKARGTLAVSSAVRRADGVHLRVIAPSAPRAGAVSLEPTLEDAYLYTMQRAGAA